MMFHNANKPGIDFADYINERVDHFTGRHWVFKAIDNWLADPNGRRVFLIIGEPGSGKSAIASRLCQFSESSSPSPSDCHYLTKHFLGATHFCSARDSLLVDPYTFVKSIALQLAERYPAYGQALIEENGEKQITIMVDQHIQSAVTEQVIGVLIKHLDIGREAAEDAFNRMIRDPLERLTAQGHMHSIVILVDALDESLFYSGPRTILSLLAQIERFPQEVRFLLTSRHDYRVENEFMQADLFRLSSTEFRDLNRQDIQQYIENRFLDKTNLAVMVTQAEQRTRATIIQTIIQKSEGNFLYVRFLLDSLIKGQYTLTETEGLPEGLDGLYSDSLKRIVNLGKHDWLKAYAPILGTLLVAQGPLTTTQLQAFTKQSATDLGVHLNDLQQLIEEIKPQDNESGAGYSLYHQSVIDFLARPILTVEKNQSRNTFYLPMQEWHTILADHCEYGHRDIIWEDARPDMVKRHMVEQGRREYARKYYVTHLFQAREWQRLFAVLDSGKYGRAKLRHDPSARLYAQDLELGQQAAAWSGWTLEEGVRRLPLLWRYSLLRCCLISRANSYPSAAF